jgi:hypothetical protein
MKYRCGAKIIEENDELKKKYKEIEEKEKKYFGIIQDFAHSSTKTSSTLNYVIKHFNNAPPIELIEGKNITQQITYTGSNKRSQEDIILFNYKSKNLDQFLGDLIIKTYKKDKPEDQSFWATDSSRFSFIIRQLIGGTKTKEWSMDKSGIKITALIIDPFLDEVREMLIEYNKNGCKFVESLKNINDNTKILKLRDMHLSQEIILLIKQKDLHKSILKYITPYFNFDTCKASLAKSFN